jgi:hypothetical protein
MEIRHPGKTRDAESPDRSIINYLIISVTCPAPIVLPPSRIANLNPLLIATGTISTTLIVTLSPGIIISLPSGRKISPVTSVFLNRTVDDIYFGMECDVHLLLF